MQRCWCTGARPSYSSQRSDGCMSGSSDSPRPFPFRPFWLRFAAAGASSTIPRSARREPRCACPTRRPQGGSPFFRQREGLNRLEPDKASEASGNAEEFRARVRRAVGADTRNLQHGFGIRHSSYGPRQHRHTAEPPVVKAPDREPMANGRLVVAVMQGDERSRLSKRYQSHGEMMRCAVSTPRHRAFASLGGVGVSVVRPCPRDGASGSIAVMMVSAAVVMRSRDAASVFVSP